MTEKTAFPNGLLLASALIALANLLIINDYAGIWSGAETEMFSALLHRFPGLFGGQSLAEGLRGRDLFWGRLPSAFLVLTALLVFFRLTGRLFSVPHRRMALFVALAGWPLIVPGKLATTDALTFLLQTLAVLSLLRYLHLPSPSRGAVCWGAVILSALLAPVSSAILLGAWPLFLYWRGYRSAMLLKLQPWLVPALACGLFLLRPSTDLTSALRYLNWGAGTSWRLPLLFLAGLLPFLPFVIAGMIDGIRKWQKGEAQSMILVTLTCFGLAALSPVAVLGMALLAGRHLRDLELPNYPYRPVINTLSVLHLIAFFFVAVFLMIGGFFLFRGGGFRSGVGFSAVYWMGLFAIAIGLFSRNRRYVLGGLLASAGLSFFLACLQLFPLWEARRIRTRLAEIQQTTESTLIVIPPSADHPAIKALHLQAPRTGQLVIQATAPGGAAETDTLRVWNERFRQETWIVRKGNQK